jgi:hypothetical protein
MNNKAFDNCSLPEVYFHSIGAEEAKPVLIKNKSDYENNFITLSSEKRNDAEWLELAAEYNQLKDLDKITKKRIDQVRDALIGMSEAQCSTGGGIQVEKCERKGSVLYSEIPFLRDIDLDKYRGDSIEYWKVTQI